MAANVRHGPLCRRDTQSHCVSSGICSDSSVSHCKLGTAVLCGAWRACADGCLFTSSSGGCAARLMQMLVIHFFLIFKAPLFYFCLGYSREYWCGNSQTVQTNSAPFFFISNQWFYTDTPKKEKKRNHIYSKWWCHFDAHYQLMTVSSRSTILLVDGDAPWELAARPCALSGSKWISAGRSRSWHDCVHTFLMASSQNKSAVWSCCSAENGFPPDGRDESHASCCVFFSPWLEHCFTSFVFEPSSHNIRCILWF